MKLVILIACCIAVVLAVPKPDQPQEEEQQQKQLRRRLQGLRLKLADNAPYRIDQKNDRYHDRDREEDYLRKIVQRGNTPVLLAPRNTPVLVAPPRSTPVLVAPPRSVQLPHDLGSLSFRYYPPANPYPVHAERTKHDADTNPGLYQDYYRGTNLREQDQDREDDEEDQD